MFILSNTKTHIKNKSQNYWIVHFSSLIMFYFAQTIFNVPLKKILNELSSFIYFHFYDQHILIQYRLIFLIFILFGFTFISFIFILICFAFILYVLCFQLLFFFSTILFFYCCCFYFLDFFFIFCFSFLSIKGVFGLGRGFEGVDLE